MSELTDKERTLVRDIFTCKRFPVYRLTKGRNVEINGREVGFVKAVDLEKQKILIASLNVREPKFVDFNLNLEG